MVASFCRLSLTFDASSLAAELARFAAAEWHQHFNADYHDGGWTGVPLRAVAGSAVQLYPAPVPDAAYADMPVLAALPGFRQALAQFHCPLQAVRLLRLAAGSHIREHRDYGLGFDDGVIRLHVPLQSGPDVQFYLDGTRVSMAPGECWYLEFGLPHRVQNNGATDRIHLVLDCEVNDWLLAQFPDAAEWEEQQRDPRLLAANDASSERQLERFCAQVLGDPLLQAELRAEAEPARFVALALAVGRRHGFAFTAEDVDAAMGRARRAWLERSLVP